MNSLPSIEQAENSENVDATLANRPKRYNTRAAARRALADISNLTVRFNARGGRYGKSSSALVHENNTGAARPTILKNRTKKRRQNQVKDAKAHPPRPQSVTLDQSFPKISYAEHVLVGSIAAEVYSSSLKLPLDVIDIDSQDLESGNHSAEAGLATTIHRSQMNREIATMPSSNYLRRSNLKSDMRTTLVDWLVDVHKEFQLPQAALFLAVNTIDRFLSTKDTTVVRGKFQLVGVTCMWIAAKFEAVYHPCLDDFVYIVDNAYTSAEILGMEALICNKLNFTFSVPTALPFVDRGLKALRTAYPGADGRITQFSHYTLELALCDYGMLKYRPSMLAASAISLAVQTLAYKEVHWNATMHFHTGGYSAETLQNCVQDLWKLINGDFRSLHSKICAVRRKYSANNFHSVALMTATLNL